MGLTPNGVVSPYAANAHALGLAVKAASRRKIGFEETPDGGSEARANLSDGDAVTKARALRVMNEPGTGAHRRHP
jgi:hypothetical protein